MPERPPLGRPLGKGGGEDRAGRVGRHADDVVDLRRVDREPVHFAPGHRVEQQHGPGGNRRSGRDVPAHTETHADQPGVEQQATRVALERMPVHFATAVERTYRAGLGIAEPQQAVMADERMRLRKSVHHDVLRFQVDHPSRPARAPLVTTMGFERAEDRSQQAAPVHDDRVQVDRIRLPRQAPVALLAQRGIEPDHAVVHRPHHVQCAPDPAQVVQIPGPAAQVVHAQSLASRDADEAGVGCLARPCEPARHGRDANRIHHADAARGLLTLPAQEEPATVGR